MDYLKIFNKNVIKIIEVLSKDRMYLNQISELTGIKSKNNVIKNLNALADLKILHREKNKSNTFYSINFDNQFALILLQLVNIKKLQNLPFNRRKTILEIVETTKPILAVLFGSSAKGDYKKESDIDLLLIYDQRNKTKIKEMQSIGSRFGIRINPIIIGFSELDTRDSTIQHIFKTGYPITGHMFFYEVLKNV